MLPAGAVIIIGLQVRPLTRLPVVEFVSTIRLALSSVVAQV